MKRVHLLIGAALAMTSAWAAAQKSPESLLPPGFDKPAPRPSRAATPQAAPSPSLDIPRIEAEPVIQAVPDGASAPRSAGGAAKPAGPAAPRLPSVAELQALSPEDLGDILGLKPKGDIPAAARRAMKQVGILDMNEGGFAPLSLAGQNASLVSAVIRGNKGQMVSRWGHILLRRALVSRMDAPAGMNPADFAGMRAALLVRMGEGEAARALAQDVDTGNYSPELAQAAFDAYVATADFTGICPVSALQGAAHKEPQWELAGAMCGAFRGDGSAAMSQLDRALSRGKSARVDVLLAQKYAGAAGKARRAVKIEWDGVKDMTPWRYGLTIAVGLEPPAALLKNASPRYAATAATAPMLGLPARAAAADRAAAAGVLSSAAMVDLYSQIYAQEDIDGEWAGRAATLRQAYVAATPADRVAAIRQLWDGTSAGEQHYSRQVLTAYAAARLPVDKAYAEDSGALIASMLAAGLDRNALAWAPLASIGSEPWALLSLAAPNRATPVQSGALASYNGNDESEEGRRSAFLLAGLAGLGRVTPETARDFAEKLNLDLDRQTRWSVMIDKAAEVGNPALVALLAGVGMQGRGWDKMTARHLFHIVSALNKVGLEAEARMIAAEAVARG